PQPVADAWVEARSHVQDPAHRAPGADDNRAGNDCLGGKDRRLRLIDDGLAGHRPGCSGVVERERSALNVVWLELLVAGALDEVVERPDQVGEADRKSTRLNSSHGSISYA